MKNFAELEEYLARVLGNPPRLAPIPDRELAALPLYLRDSYQLALTSIQGTKLVLARTSDGESESGLSRYAAEREVLERALGTHVALVLPDLPAYQRNRLVRQRIPFIVPGRQLFLPTLLIDLRERFSRPRSERGSLTASTQTVVLYYLLGNDTTGSTLQDLAETLGYSAMTMSNARKELAEAGYIETTRSGTSVSLAFLHPRRELWKSILERLRSPVRTTQWARWKAPLPVALKAGTTALSELTLSGDDVPPTYAVHAPAWKKATREDPGLQLREPYDADAAVQLWKYDPSTLSEEGRVDPLSLYLSLQDSGDERVLAAIEEVIENMPW